MGLRISHFRGSGLQLVSVKDCGVRVLAAALSFVKISCGLTSDPMIQVPIIRCFKVSLTAGP